MPSTKEYVQWILDALAPAGDVRVRAMMGEYVLYYKDKVVGGIYDERLLLKNAPAAEAVLGSAPLEIPYDGAKPMLLVNPEDLSEEQLRALMDALFDALPAPRKRKKPSGNRTAAP